mmetsp:Transcript_1476/g.5783  ORF Transcript_1476/g.5783 Transcript_1476/m.5783 type:complete len:290 (-) Transcript_1476:1476-2345(-)
MDDAEASIDAAQRCTRHHALYHTDAHATCIARRKRDTPRGGCRPAEHEAEVKATMCVNPSFVLTRTRGLRRARPNACAKSAQPGIAAALVGVGVWPIHAIAGINDRICVVARAAARTQSETQQSLCLRRAEVSAEAALRAEPAVLRAVTRMHVGRRRANISIVAGVEVEAGGFRRTRIEHDRNQLRIVHYREYRGGARPAEGQLAQGWKRKRLQRGVFENERGANSEAAQGRQRQCWQLIVEGEHKDTVEDVVPATWLQTGPEDGHDASEVNGHQHAIVVDRYAPLDLL